MPGNTSCAPLAALGDSLRQQDCFAPIRPELGDVCSPLLLAARRAETSRHGARPPRPFPLSFRKGIFPEAILLGLTAGA
jgi:hypothetical protein